MMIRKIKIQNFKSIKELEIENVKPLVGIWGKNGSGKSSIIQSLVVLKNAALQISNPTRGNVRYSGDIHVALNRYGVSLGDLKDVIYSHNVKNTLGIEVFFDNNLENTLKLGTTNSIKVEVPDYKDIVRYFPPWRRISNRYSDIKQKVDRDLAQNSGGIHVYIHWFIHKKLYEKLNTGKENELDRINSWAVKLGYGSIFDEQVSSQQVIGKYMDPILNVDVPIVDGGYGGNTFLPILFEGYSFIDGILLIEEPEISLHPGAQSDILDFFIEMATERKHQIIFTSHSEYILRKIARYYQEEKIDEDMIDIVYIWKDDKGTHHEKKELEELSKKFREQKDILPELRER